ncbi:helix-turn-helix domain-containing protein [Aquimarina algiphila]|uniref:AraC family transcriptional regulator n=1 Tax=Aquimarina algiphila TaxID=2047982 RepID=A0A554VJK3_9FLAO|nr:helix-turn-helix domain-containing protein [Aquimarina algiphila]TSE08098.1 AraC family transcriptional regulator [Aquimarina algiphila]
MSKEIPNISFKTQYPEIKGIEIFLFEDLIERKDNLDHNPEKAHQLEFYMLAFYTSGTMQHLVDFTWHEVQENTIVYLVKGQVNAFNFKKNVKGFIILFTEEYFNERLNHLPSDAVIRLFTSHLFSPKIKIPESSSVNNYIQLLYKEFYDEDDSQYNKKNIINYLYNILFSKLEQLQQYQTFYLKDSGKLNTFLKFKSLLENNFYKSRNADFYASELHISYKHLNTICKEIINITAKKFIDEFIILKAKRSLINSSIKSTQLAFSMGFEESSNFVKYFKKHTGLTPNMFKKLHD